ncbi:MAG: adenosylmethionine decarboxylase [Thermoanaerobaculia bacterium]|nr:adenosylmethionine decarboxylase [Thermoanaerobaculia bacterium]
MTYRHPSQAFGSHVLLDVWGVEQAILDDPDALRRHMSEAARRGGATVVEERFHRFAPQGVSGVVVLAESHVAVHTWPEHGFAALDVFTCGHPDMTRRIADHLLASLQPGDVEIRRVDRGVPRRSDAFPAKARAS